MQLIVRGIPLRDFLALGPDAHGHPEANRQALEGLHQLALVHHVHLRTHRKFHSETYVHIH